MKSVSVTALVCLFFSTAAMAAKPVPPPTLPLVSSPPSQLASEYNRLVGERSKNAIRSKVAAALEQTGRDSSAYEIDTTPGNALGFKYVFYAADRYEVCRLGMTESNDVRVVDCISK